MGKINVRQLVKDIKDFEKQIIELKDIMHESHQPRLTWKTHYDLAALKQKVTTLYCLRALSRNTPRIHLKGRTLEDMQSLTQYAKAHYTLIENDLELHLDRVTGLEPATIDLVRVNPSTN